MKLMLKFIILTPNFLKIPPSFTMNYYSGIHGLLLQHPSLDPLFKLLATGLVFIEMKVKLKKEVISFQMGED